MLAAGSGHLFVHTVYDVLLLDRSEKRLDIGRALLLGREKVLCVHGGPPHGAACQIRACILIASHCYL